MSYHEYQCSREISRTDPPFYALIMAAMNKADTINGAKLRAMWPDVWNEAEARYNAPGAKLEGE